VSAATAGVSEAIDAAAHAAAMRVWIFMGLSL
jgi:hypothetical protein